MINFKKLPFHLIIIFIAAVIVFYQFPDLPKNLAFDEVEFAQLALSLENKPYTPYSPLATGHSTLYFYVILLSLKIFGINSFALRLPSALAGIACVFLFFKISEIIFKKKSLAFLLALIFVTLRWFFGFARFAFEPVFLLFLELMSIYFFLLFNKSTSGKKSNIHLFLSGLFAGFAYNSYTPGRIFFLLPLIFLILKLVNPSDRKQNKKNNKLMIKQFLYFIIPLLITITPLTNYLLKNEDIRVSQLFFLSNQDLSIQKKIDFFGENISKTIKMFFLEGDPNGKHNYPYKPALNPVAFSLFIIGIIISSKFMPKFINNFFLFYLIISLFPTLLVYPWENPSMLRTYTALPSIVYFLGNTIVIFHQIINQIKNRKVFRYLILTTFYLLLILSSFYELRTYFFYQSKVLDHAFEIKKPLQDVINCQNIFECQD